MIAGEPQGGQSSSRLFGEESRELVWNSGNFESRIPLPLRAFHSKLFVWNALFSPKSASESAGKSDVNSGSKPMFPASRFSLSNLFLVT